MKSEIMRCTRCKQEVEVFQVPRFLEPKTYVCGLCLTPKKLTPALVELPVFEPATQTRWELWE